MFLIILTACTSTNFLDESEQIPASKLFTAAEFELSHGLAIRNQFPAADVFRIGDTLEVVIHGQEKFSGTYLVDANGMTHFVYLTEIPVAGISVTKLQNTLRKKYNNCCLSNPSISIRKETNSLGRIVVDGAVDAPGAFAITSLIRVSEAVALAGGSTDVANKKEVMLARMIDDERKIMLVNLENIYVLGEVDPIVYPNDVIYVQDNTARILYNEFLRAVPLLVLADRITN